jgi:phage baseplate assembly protein W
MVATIDIYCTNDFLPTMPSVSGRTALKQRISRRLQTRRGVLALRPDFGLDVRDYLLSGATPVQIERDVTSEVEKDEQVRAARVTATVGPEQLELVIGIEDEDGEFEFTLTIADAAASTVGDV